MSKYIIYIIYIYVLTYMHVTTINKKEAMRVYERRKGRERGIMQIHYNFKNERILKQKYISKANKFSLSWAFMITDVSS